MLDIWTEDDETGRCPIHKLRQIIFINSAAAFVGLPGSVAYIRKKFLTLGARGTFTNER